jgi:mRNA interferase HigB
MRVISRPRLRKFWEAHPDAERPLKAWWKVALAADWADVQQVRAVYPHADAVKLDCDLLVTVFNIGGNKYRLVTRVIYEYRRIYIKAVLTHREYDSEKWKDQLCRE